MKEWFKRFTIGLGIIFGSLAFAGLCIAGGWYLSELTGPTVTGSVMGLILAIIFAAMFASEPL